MSNYYTTGTFAKMANVTQRTIRYYDKIGLLKPSMMAENGYRKYSDSDFLKIQKIVSLRNLGFSIEEIFPIIMNENEKDIKQSLQMQTDLIEKRIEYLKYLDESLKKVLKSVEEKDFNWEKIIALAKLTNMESKIVEQYKSATNLNVRIALHDAYSINEEGWFTWLYKQIDFTKINRLLEIGCGNGRLWENSKINIRNREFFLSDKSERMLESVKKKVGKDFNFLLLDCESIPFKANYFDSIIANHVLFYIEDLNNGLMEINRVLKEKGLFYCTAYGKDHMKEISQLVYKFDNRIILSETNLYNKFGLENGESILKEYFSTVQRIDYLDALEIDEVQPLVDYILSCFGNQNEIIANKLEEFKLFLAKEIEAQGIIRITKNAGLFICKK